MLRTSTPPTSQPHGWCCAAALALFCACAEAPAAQQERPNVLLVSVDSLRADHLGAYGYARDTSPIMDGLAAEGVRFDQTMSSTSWTLPSHASLFTGLTNAGHGCTSARPKLRGSAETLAERLRDAGYRTAGFWSGPYLHPAFGLGQGFEDYVNCTNYDYGKGRAPGGQREANRLSHEDITSPKMTSNVLEWMQRWSEEASERPFFLFVHMWDVHYDFFPPAPYASLFTGDYAGSMDGTLMRKVPGHALAQADKDHSRALYDGEIAWTDEHLGRILEALEEHGWAQDTLVILTADHGEEFWERGGFGHRKTLFEESVRIPLIMRYPGRLEGGVVVESPTGIVDIMPTVLELCGLELGLGEDWLPGVSLVPQLEGREPLAERAIFSELARPKPGDSRVAIRAGRWKSLFDPEKDALLGLWDLAADPAEADNQVGAEGELIERERQRALAAYGALRALEGEDRLGGAGQAGSDAVPEDVNQALQDLGYIGGDEDEHE